MLYARNARERAMTVEEEFRVVRFQDQKDPRIPVEETETSGLDGVTELWLQQKYPSISSPIPLATWEEAQPILAEAELEAGNTGEAVAIINRLHSRVGLPAYGGGSQDEVRQRLIEEQKAELFLKPHHLGDVRYYGLELTPPPSGVDAFGVTYGKARCFPLPDAETQNNSNT